MKKIKMFSVCLVLVLIFCAVLFAEVQDERASHFAKILRIGDGDQIYIEKTGDNENGFSAEIVLPKPRENASCKTENREEYILHLFFDQPPLNIYVLNDDVCYVTGSFTWSDDYTDAQASIPEGTYDIIVEYFVEDDYTYRNIIQEDVVINENMDIIIESTEAIYTVDLNPVDENGEEISLNDQVFGGTIVVQIYTPMQSYPSTIIGVSVGGGDPMPNYIKQSSVSENYSFELMQMKVKEGKVYQLYYDEYSGVNSNIELTNDPSDYHYSQAAFSFNPDAGQQYLGLGRAYITGTDCTRSLFLVDSYPIENNTVLYVYTTSIYDPMKTTCGFFFATMGPQQIVPEIMTPNYLLTQEEQKVACTWNFPPANNDAVIDDGECLSFGMTIPYFFAIGKNNSTGNSISFYRPRIRGFENQWLYNNLLMNTNTTYEVTHNGEIISSGPFITWGSVQDLLAETYTFTLNYNSYYIEDTQGTAEYNLTFDLGADDPDSPVLTSLRIKDEDGETITSLPQNGNGTIEFTAADFSVDLNYDLTYSDIDSAKVYYKDYNADEWQELTINEESSLSDTVGGKYFIGDMSSITTQYTNGTYVDLKILITDETGNTYQATLVPALYISEEISVDDPVYPTQSSIISSIGPNPFNDNTTIRFSLAKPSSVRMDVYNVRGEKVRTLVDEDMEADSHTITWNGKDNAGKQVSNGIYFCKIKANNVTETRKMMLVH